MNNEMAYLLGMVTGNGEIQRGVNETTVVIEIPHKKLETEFQKDVAIYVKASITDIRQVLEPLLGTSLMFNQSANVSYLSFSKSNEDYLMREILRYIGRATSHENIRISPEVFSFTEDEEKQHKNTRKKYEIELRKQLFLILDTESQLLYLSDITKKGAIKAYFTEELQADIIIKNLYSSLDEFQKSVKVLKKLKFTQYRNISNTLDKESIFMQQANELGLDMPEKIMMQIEYPNTFVGNLKNGIQILKKKKDQGYFSDIILIGEDDFGIEQSFDFTSIIKNIEVAVRKNEDDRYDENEVERNFFEKIR